MLTKKQLIQLADAKETYQILSREEGRLTPKDRAIKAKLLETINRLITLDHETARGRR